MEALLEEAVTSKAQAKASAPIHLCYFIDSDMLDAEIELVISQLWLPRVDQRIGKRALFVENFLRGDCRVSARLFCNGFPIHIEPVTTRLNPRASRSGCTVKWEDPLTFPTKYRDLTGDATIVLDLKDANGTTLGGTTLPFFSYENSRLAEGRQHLFVYLGESGDGCLASDTFRMQGGQGGDFLFHLDRSRDSVCLGRTGLDKATRQYLGEALQILTRANRAHTDGLGDVAISSTSESEALTGCYLEVELPRPSVPVIFNEGNYHLAGQRYVEKHIQYSFADPAAEGRSVEAWASDCSPPLSVTRKASLGNSYGWSFAFMVDSEVDDDGEAFNVPAVEMYNRMHKDIERGTPIRGLVPSHVQRFEMEKIILAPTDKISATQRNLLWRFQHFLTDRPAAVVKFVLSVDWKDERERAHAIETLQEWERHKEEDMIDIADALKLLSKTFEDPVIRTFAVKRLSKASDAELNAYLLQLVAALRYEPKRIATWEDFESPPLARLLVERACRAKAPYRLANFLYWYLKVEIDAVQVRSKNNKDNPPLPHDEENGQMYAKVLQALFDRLAETAPNVKDALDRQAAVFKTISDYQLDSKEIRGNRDAKLKDLKSKLKNIAQRGFDPLVSSPLNPNVQLKNIMPSETHMFKSALYPAKIVFERIPNVEGKEAWVAEEPAAQRGNPPPDEVSSGKGVGGGGCGGDGDSEEEDGDIAANKKKKQEEALRKRLGNVDMKVVKERKQVSGKYEKMNVLDAFKDIKIKEKEALEKKQKTYSIMLKNGDDVRQDQLIMQLIKIMDDKLKTINMDLELVPYGILSTAAESGLLEFITAKDGSRSWTMSEVLATHNNSVLDFLRRYNPDASTDNKVSAQCMSTFVRSCAGYAVVTFLLGIGDRHLDNVMMLQDGHFVHIDFGWIFGEDPKKKFVKPPPFRFHKSLLDAMSGKTGAYFQEFCNKAKAAYLHLRRHASLLLSLCRLMVDAGIEAFVLVGQRGGDPEDLLKVMLDRFRLEENDEIAGMYFDDIISESVNHRGVEALESFHKIAVSLR